MTSLTDDKIVLRGLTYDDVLLLPAYSNVMPRDVSTATYLTPDVPLNIPFVSAAMDTVTESRMAIAMAREGGIGILHKNMSIAAQADEVRRVKRSESGMIVDPITLAPNKTVADARSMMAQYAIGGIPVVDERGKLVGIVTNRDLRFITDGSVTLSDVMTPQPLVVAPEGTDLEQAEALLQAHRIEKLPVVNQEGILKGLITFKDIEKKRKFPLACKDHLGRLRVGAAVGVTADALERVQALVDAGVDVITLDTAHGHSQGVYDTIAQIRSTFASVQLIGGNVATADGAEHLIKAGVNAIKVGIGPGSICTTRIVAGVGVPQLTAVLEASKTARKFDIPVIGDGGIKQTGDVAKSLAAGASAVMIGGLFARVDESPGETILYEGRRYKSYRGMGSLGAMEKGSSDRYFQDAEDDIKKLVPEGIEGRVPYSGTLHEVMYQMIGGLRAAMGYCGADTIERFYERSRFVEITSAGALESHPHSVAITKEAPNYSTKQ